MPTAGPVFNTVVDRSYDLRHVTTHESIIDYMSRTIGADVEKEDP